MRRLLLTLAVLGFPVLALAQEEPPAPEGGVNWLHWGAVAVNALVLPLAVELLKPLWAKAPSWLKSFVPLFVGSLIVMGEAALLQVFGEPIDLALLEQVFLGSTLGIGATMAYKRGQASG